MLAASPHVYDSRQVNDRRRLPEFNKFAQRRGRPALVA
jgi:hypothetical protein